MVADEYDLCVGTCVSEGSRHERVIDYSDIRIAYVVFCNQQLLSERHLVYAY